ncbi:MAG: ABC transporter permease [Nitriliruptorales bacterium]|nr:ABC transporter permease [Nitriliruptorales bacterium]
MTAVTAGRRSARAAARPRGSALAGTGTLIRFILRRDRIRIPVWIGAITAYVLLTAAALPDLYLTAAQRQSRAALMGNPAARALAGPGHGLEDYTFGAMMTQEMLGFTAVLVALMSLLLIVRHTRAEEAEGRAELVRASVVGRHATATAALVVVGAANLVLGALVAAGLGSLGIESIPWSGSLLFGASLAAVGLVFTGVAAVTAQVTEHSRGASGLAGVVLGSTYSLRAAGDMGDGTLSWLSPIGWAQATRAYVDDRWWPLGLTLALTAVLIAVAFAVSARRDLGAGLVPPRPGPPAASAVLGSPFGLAFRLQRASLLGWSIAMFLFALGYGTLVGEVERFITDNPQMLEFFAQAEGPSLIHAFLATIVSFWAMVASVYAILAALRLRSEENAGRAEPVLSTAVSRARWAASHLAIALVGSVILLLVSGLGLGLTSASSTGDASLLPQMVGAALAYAPVLWLIIGAAAALFGLVPRAAALSWTVVVYALTVGMLGGLLGFPDWTYQLSPFDHVPMLPGEGLRLPPLVVLTAIAAVLITVGLAGFRRRDVGA